MWQNWKHNASAAGMLKQYGKKVQNNWGKCLEMILFGLNSNNNVSFPLSIAVYSVYLQKMLDLLFWEEVEKKQSKLFIKQGTILYRENVLYDHCKHTEFSNICEKLLERVISYIS